MEPARLESLIEALREVGLGRYEAAVYLGLLMDETAKVSEISKRTGVPQPKTYQALDALVDKGFCTLGSDAVNRYRPLRPADALQGALESLRASQERVAGLGEELEEMRIAGQGRALWAPPIEVIKGLPQVERFIRERIAEAEREVLLFGKLPHMPGVDIADALRDLVRRGGKLKMLVEEGFLDAEAEPVEAPKYAALEAEMRVVDALPTKMIVLDRQVAISSITHSGGRPLDLVLRHDGFVEHFVSSFEHTWSLGRPLRANNAAR